MGKITVLKGENLTLSTGRVLAVFNNPALGTAGSRCKVKRLEIFQRGTTTLEMQAGELFTRDNAGTLTTTSLAPTATKPVNGPASGFSGNTSVIGGTGRSGINSSADSGGTYTQIMPFGFANTAGYLYKPAPDEEPEFPASTIWGVRLLSTPTTLSGWGFSLTIEEE